MNSRKNISSQRSIFLGQKIGGKKFILNVMKNGKT